MNNEQLAALIAYVEAIRLDAISNARHGTRCTDDALSDSVVQAKERLEQLCNLSGG